MNGRRLLAHALLALGLAGAAPAPEAPGPVPLGADPEGWAAHPVAVAAPDGTVLVAWSQHTRPAQWTLSGVHVKRGRGTQWEALGGRIGHVPGKDGANNAEAYAPALAVAGDTPYVAWYEGGGYGWGQVKGVTVRSSVFVAHWDGREWVPDPNPGMPNGALNSHPEAAARGPRLAVLDGAPVAAWIESRATRGGGAHNVIVTRRLSGGAWAPAGPDLATEPARIVDLDIATVAGALHVAWSEVRLGRPPRRARLSVARLDGGAWVALAAPPTATADASVNHVAIAEVAGAPLVAWQEQVGGAAPRLVAARGLGARWGPPAALSTDGAEAGRPALAARGPQAWAAWAEGGPGERARLQVRAWDGNAWSAAAGPLNADPGGAADAPALAATGDGRVLLAWAEKRPPPGLKQVYARALR